MNKPKVIVVGGGFAGIGAAVAAKKAGAEVTLLERTDLLSGAGLRAGRVYHNGKIIIAEESKALGVSEVFEALEAIVLHRGNIIDEEGAAIYHVGLVDGAMRKVLEAAGIDYRTEARAVDVEKQDGALKAVTTAAGDRFGGDVFIDTSGTFGGLRNCVRYGYGCVMCVHRCLYFGDRVSIATKAGAEELHWTRPDGTPGALGASITFHKDSLSPELKAKLERDGAFSIPIPEELIDYSRMKHMSAARGPREVAHVNIVNHGLGAKCVGMGYFPLSSFRKIPGFENAQIEHPWGGGGRGFLHSISYTPREDSMLAKGFTNLFVAGDKSGIGGIAEVIGIGILAGHNAARVGFGMQPIELPRASVLGDMIAFRGESMARSEDIRTPISLAHGAYYKRVKEMGLAGTDPAAIQQRIAGLGLSGLFGRRLA